MSNSVDNVSGNNLLNATEQASRIKEVAGKKDKDVDEAQREATKAKPAATDEVVLTDSAKRLQAIERALESVPITDKAKVKSIQDRIADGSFQINAENIAEKLLATDKLLT